MSTFDTKTENSSNDSLFADNDSKASNRNNSDLDRKKAAPDRAIRTLDD